MGVMVLVYILSLYVIPALLSFWIYYAHWCKNTDEGSTIEDMDNWLRHNVSFNTWACFTPILNWVTLAIAIVDVYGDKISKLKIRRK